MNKTLIYDAVNRGYRWANWKNNLLFKHQPKNYLFILSQPYAGSTILHQILSNHPKISPLNTFGTREGFGLKVSRKQLEFNRLWDKAYEIPFEKLKPHWEKQWDLAAHYLLEKSPPQILRAHHIQSVFRTSYFIALLRDPYALALSYHQRNQVSIKEAASFTMQCFNYHLDNKIGIDHILYIKYEDLTDHWEITKKDLQLFLSQMDQLDLPKSLKAHNQTGNIDELKNMNEAKFSSIEQASWDELNHYFLLHEELLQTFNYSLRISPGA